ncbi:MAG: AlkA N-terminal domain-containing protein [Planctomycetota bacterium]
MHLDENACYRALASRDYRFDGKFFVGVRTTRVYCRPICPAPTALQKNCRFFLLASEAEADGFRPCLRCFPERSPHHVANQFQGTLVNRALRLIEKGVLDEGGVQAVAERLDVTTRHLRRIFVDQLGVPPIAVARTRRVQMAKRLIDETRLSMTQVAFAAGFNTIRQFNGTFRAVYGRSPREFRRAVKPDGKDVDSRERIRLRLSYRPPFDWNGMLDFMRPRLLGGVEMIEDGVFFRRVSMGEDTVVISISPGKGNHLILDLPWELWEHAHALVTKARWMFDLDSDPNVIGEQLSTDRLLRGMVKRNPALRMPRCWEPFEMSIRAILGQQVSVAGASTLCGRLIQKWGTKVKDAVEPAFVFPTDEKLSRVSVAAIGIPEARANAIRGFSRAVAAGTISLEAGLDLSQFLANVTALPGIGDWTANYLAMRVLGEPDAFPAGDLGVRKALSTGEKLVTQKTVLQRAENWRPWRGYAAMLIWMSH